MVVTSRQELGEAFVGFLECLVCHSGKQDAGPEGMDHFVDTTLMEEWCVDVF